MGREMKRYKGTVLLETVQGDGSLVPVLYTKVRQENRPLVPKVEMHVNVIFPIEKLINAAGAAREKAYAPYSNFKVGAAILTKEGRYYTGCNIENASYGLTCCAERVALFKAVSNNERDFEAIALTAGTSEFCSPCGACRQVLAEFGTNIKIYMANETGEYRMQTVAELLPDSFKLKTLTPEEDVPEVQKTITKLIEPVNR